MLLVDLLLSACKWFPGLRLQRWPSVLLLCAVAGLAGCATQQVTQVTLSGVVVGERALTGPINPDLVRVRRGPAELVVAPNLVLQPGDAIWTGPDTAVVVSYPGGARAYVYPNTRTSIGSLFIEIGKVFVKVRGVFQVRTTFVTAASEGTQYWVNVQPGGVRTVVVDGRVSLYSNTGAWATRLDPVQQAVARSGSLQESSPADPAEIRRELEWVARKDALVPVKTSLNMGALGVGAAAAAAIWYIHKSDRRDPPRSPPGEPVPPVPQTAPMPSPSPAPMPAPAPVPGPVPGTRSPSDGGFRGPN